MDLMLIRKFVVFLYLILQSKGQMEDQINDCVACNTNPVEYTRNYSCKVRCEATSKIVRNVKSDVKPKVRLSSL